MPSQVSATVTVAFSHIVEPRENLGNQLEWTIGVRVPDADMLQFEDAFVKEIQDKQKIGKFPKPTPKELNKPWRPSQEKQEDGTKIPVPGENLVIFKRKVIRKVRGEEVRNNPPIVFDSLGGKVPNPPKLGRDSKVKVIYDTYAYDHVKQGVQFQLIGVQIVELKEAASELKLAPVEGGWQAERDVEGIDALQAILND